MVGASLKFVALIRELCDLSPIETVWELVEARGVEKFGKEELRRYIREAWDAIPQSSIDRAVESFQQRCRDCVKNRGNLINSGKSPGGS